MRKAFLFIAAMLMLGVGNVWGTTYTYDFRKNASGTAGSDVTDWYSNSTCTTHLKSGNTNTLSGTIYYKDGAAFNVEAADAAYFMNSKDASALLIGKSGSLFTLPTYSGEKITSIKITCGSNSGSKVTCNMYSGETKATNVENQVGDKSKVLTFAIQAAYQSSALSIKVTNANNFQIAQIDVTTETDVACSSKVAITKGTESHGTFEIGGLDAEGKVCADGDGGEIVVTPTADAHYHVASISPTATDNEDGTYTISGIKAATTVSVNFAENAKANVSWSVNGTLVSGGSTFAYVGEKVAELPNAPLSSACDGVKAFVGWSDAPVTDGNKPSVLFSKAEDAPEITSSEDVTYYAVFATETEGGSTTTATFNAVGMSTAAYGKGTHNDDQGKTWSYYAAVNNQSGTFCYALNSNASNYNIGSPKYEGNITAISLKAYNGSSSEARKLLLCSNNSTAQPETGDLAEVSINKSEKFSTTYNVDLSEAGDFSQFYIYAAKALSVSEVKVTYSSSSYSNYATTCETSTPIIVVEPNKAVGHAASTGEEIAYEIKNAVGGVSLSASVNPEASWLTNIAVNAASGKITFDVTANTSHKEVRTATITLTYEGAADAEVVVTQACEPLATMDAIFAAAATPDNYSITFNNWVISAVSGNNAYLTDGTKGLIIYNKSHGFKVGDVLSGTVMCSLTLFKGASEITTLTSTTEGLEVVAGGTVTAIEKSIADLSGVNTGALVTIKGIVTEEDKAAGQTSVVFADAAENKISVYKTLMTLPAFTGGIGYNMTGIYIQYDATKELAPRSAADIEEVPVAKYAISVASPIENGSVSVDPDDEAAEGQKVTVTFEPNDGYKLASYSITDGIRLDAKNQFAMPAKPVEISAVFAVKEQYNITWMAKGEEFAVTQILEGDALEIPAAKPEGVGKYSFAGWTASASVETDVEPEYVSASTVIISDTTLYAVFGVAQESVDAYMLVESDRADWSGKYLIAANDSTFANGAIGGKDDEGSIGKAQTHVDPKDNLSADKKTIAKAWGDLYYVTLDTIAKGGYVLKTQDGKYNYQTSNANGLTASDKKATAAQYPISVVFNAADDVDLALGGNATGAIFHYNKNSGSEMFRFYKDGGQNAVYLYRYENYTIYSDYTLEPKAEPTALQNIMLNKGVKKAIMNGHLMIMREGRMYNAFGGRMR